MLEQPTQSQDLSLAQRGDSRAFERLFAPVKPYARSLSSRFFVSGWEKEDLYQEALAGFVGALWEFEGDRGLDFHDYARLRMRNAVVACVRRATCVKRGRDALTSSLDGLASTASDQFRPDLVVEQQCECDDLLASLESLLSPAEWEVLKSVLAGNSLAEVADRSGGHRSACRRERPFARPRESSSPAQRRLTYQAPQVVDRIGRLLAGGQSRQASLERRVCGDIQALGRYAPTDLV